ncbi:LysR family transcriptional regulator [Ferviditalea candida]|uniref:LysR family transcriptional regulator n=1 Tax=Ferviditalea candida TaxID=3108399 RepID=A0ABU5ZKV8_9BACL|nr:LysR family transcriptional regulator [Paenibacillaceae bacterium T2]
MEIHQLKYVLAVEKYMNFSLAADEIYISQPTLSQQIEKLKDELGVDLFFRTTRSL